MAILPHEIEAFVEETRRFLTWCETPHVGKQPELFQLESLQMLARIYSAALRLPNAEPDVMPDSAAPSPEQRAKVAANFSSLPFQYYWEVFTPSELEGDKEPVCGDLFDDFLDIYVDLTRGLSLFDAGHPEAAVFEWRFAFGIHWGRHAVSAMHALHSWQPSEEHAG